MRSRIAIGLATILFNFTCFALADEESDRQRLYSRNHFDRDYRLIYARAWKLIKDDYWDGKFNGQIWSRWEHKFDSKLNSREDLQNAISEMVKSLGKYGPTYLVDPELDEQLKNKAYLFGLGIVITKTVDAYPLIRNILNEDSPFVVYDTLLKVNGKSLKRLSLAETVSLLRGEANLALVVSRGDRERTISVVRDQSQILNELRTEIFAGNVGYIRVGNLASMSSSSLLKIALKKVENCNSLIFDLRSRAGGTLSTIIEIASLFLKNKPIVSTIDNEGYQQSTNSLNDPLFTKPLVLLINSRTTGSTEILVAALKDNQRATLVGQHTAGTPAYIQGVSRLLNRDTLIIPIAQWRSPTGIDVEGFGVKPDIEIPVSPSDEDTAGPWFSRNNQQGRPDFLKDIQLQRALRVCRSF